MTTRRRFTADFKAKVALEGHCQSYSAQSAYSGTLVNSDRKLTPFGERGSTVLLEDITTVEVTVLVKVIVDGGVGGGKFLQGLDVPELRHRSFSSSKRLV